MKKLIISTLIASLAVVSLSPAQAANDSLPGSVPKGYVETDPINWKINPNYKVGKRCGGDFGWQVVGLNSKNQPAFLRCSNPSGGVFRLDNSMPKIDPKTKKPLVKSAVPAKTLFGYSPNLYIHPTIVTTQPNTPLSSGKFDDYAQCKIAEVDDGAANASYGYPLPEERLDLKKNFQILVIPLQFTDHKTTNRPESDMGDVISALSNYWVRMSSVEISFNWTIPDSYIQVGKSIDSFKMDEKTSTESPEQQRKNTKIYLQEAVDLVDQQYDFSKFDAVIVEEPRSVTDKEMQGFLPVATTPLGGPDGIYSDEGEIRGLMATGNDEIRDIPNWVHEFGHLLGLPDRNWQTDAKPGFDLMFGWYGSPELAVWHRWMLDILKDSQIDCKTDTTISRHWIRPVAWVGDYKKGVVIPVSKNVVLVAESRRRQGYDALFGKESEGVYVYRIDTSAKMYQKDTKKIVDVVKPARSRPIMDWALDAALDPGESVTSDGWKIKVLEAGSFGDVISVEKVK